jgi:hypothetical protein
MTGIAIKVKTERLLELRQIAPARDLCNVIDEALAQWIERERCPRDLHRAAAEIERTIRYRLVEFPSLDPPVAGLTDGLAHDLAAHLAQSLDLYGREIE